MATVRARLDALQSAIEIQQRGAIAELQDWVEREATDDERGAWDRDLLNMPMSDAELARAGWTRAAAETFVAAEVGPVRPNDAATIRGMMARVPAEIVDRIERVFGANDEGSDRNG